MRIWLSICVVCLLFMSSGCGPTVTIKHEVSPIYLTIDINIKIQEELEDFFSFEESRRTSGETEKTDEDKK